MWDLLLKGCHAATLCGPDYGAIRDAAIALRNGQIAWIGPASECPSGDARETRELDGAWVTPGLIDCHMHFFGARSPDPVYWSLDSPVRAALRASADARRVLTRGAPREPIDSANVEMVRNLVTAERPAAVGPLYMHGDTIRYAIVTRVQNGPEFLGYIVQRQPVAGSASGRDQLMQLIGSHAGIYIGSRDGRLWSDFVTTAEPPPVTVTADTTLLTYDRPGLGTQIATARTMGSLPWVLLVEFPRAEILARAQRSDGGPQGGRNQAAGRLTSSSTLASETNGMPARSDSPEAQVETVETPSSQPAGDHCSPRSWPLLRETHRTHGSNASKSPACWYPNQ